MRPRLQEQNSASMDRKRVVQEFLPQVQLTVADSVEWKEITKSYGSTTRAKEHLIARAWGENWNGIAAKRAKAALKSK